MSDGPSPGPSPGLSAALSSGWSGAAKGCWLAAFVVVGMLFGRAIYGHAFDPPKTYNDFVQEWTSARNFFGGDPVYQPLGESIRKHLGRDVELGVIDVNAHPPASVLLALPLGKFSYDRALHLWNAASFVALGVTLALLFGGAGPGWSAWYLLPLLTFLISSNPLAQQVLQGQLNLLLLLLVTGAWLATRHDRWLLAGVLVGLAGAIKLFPLYLGLYFLCRRRWLGVVGVGVGFFALVGASWAVLGSESYRAFFQDVAPAVAAEFQDYWPNASIHGFFRKLLHGASGHVIPLASLPWLASALSAAGCLIVTALTAHRIWTADSTAECDLSFALCVIAMMLVSPITWDHYFLMLAPFFCLLWQMSLGRPWRQAALLMLIVLLFTIRPRWIWDPTIPGDGELALLPGQTTSVAATWHVLTVVSYQFYGLLWLYGLAWTTKDDPPASAPQ